MFVARARASCGNLHVLIILKPQNEGPYTSSDTSTFSEFRNRGTENKRRFDSLLLVKAQNGCLCGEADDFYLGAIFDGLLCPL